MFINDFDQLDDYIKAHSEPESDLLTKLDRQTHLKILRPRMLSGHIQGRVLAMLSQMIQPKYIFEIGTFTGYSTICMSEGLCEDGRLITCDVNDEIEEFTKSYLNRCVKAEQIDYRIQDARELLQDNKLKFDLVFIDGINVSILSIMKWYCLM
jgi:caffeoyl-CoA O-methyltransferase